jgi:phosphate transport system protein
MGTRQHFSEKMKDLQVEILKMGGLLEEAIGKASRAFSHHDEEMANQVIEGDREINDLERRIEDLAVSMIATEQPVATDLRIIVAALKISNDLERIGDYVEHLARISINITAPPAPSQFGEIPRMAEVAATMIRDSLQAFMRQDCDLAQEARRRDDVVDGLYAQLFQRLLAYIQEHPEQLRPATALLFASKFLERLADHAANVCEEVTYVCTGRREKYVPYH